MIIVSIPEARHDGSEAGVTGPITDQNAYQELFDAAQTQGRSNNVAERSLANSGETVEAEPAVGAAKIIDQMQILADEATRDLPAETALMANMGALTADVADVLTRLEPTNPVAGQLDRLFRATRDKVLTVGQRSTDESQAGSDIVRGGLDITKTTIRQALVAGRPITDTSIQNVAALAGEFSGLAHRTAEFQIAGKEADRAAYEQAWQDFAQDIATIKVQDDEAAYTLRNMRLLVNDFVLEADNRLRRYNRDVEERAETSAKAQAEAERLVGTLRG